MQHRFSSLSKYEQCPAAHGYLMAGAPTLDAAIMQAGSLAHSVFEAYARHCLAEGVDSDLTAMPEIASRLGAPPGSEIYQTLIAPWLEAGHLFPASEIVSVEERLAVTREGGPTDPAAPDAWLAGTMDVLRAVPGEPDTMIIQDYKTGFASEANPLQMRIYAMLTLAAYPHVQTVVCEFDYTRFNVQRRRTVAREEFQEILAHVQAIGDAAEADTENVARPGEHCLTCQWRHSCGAEPACALAVATEADARGCVEAISLLQRDLETQKALLRAWCTEHGPIAHNGVVWGHHAQGEDGFDDSKAFHAACLEAGADPWPALSVNNVQARRFRTRGAWPEPLARLLVNRRTTAFRGKKEHSA